MAKVLFIAKATKEGGLEFSSDFRAAQFRDYLRANVGVQLEIKPHKGAISSEQRRFFEGAIVPTFAEFHGMEIEEARELIKKEFNGRWVKTKQGLHEKLAMSTTKLDKAQFSDFLDRITSWMGENGVPIPDPEDYKRWMESSPWADEVYKPKSKR